MTRQLVGGDTGGEEPSWSVLSLSIGGGLGDHMGGAASTVPVVGSLEG